MNTDKRRYGVFVINPETDSDNPDTMYCNAYLKPLSIFPSTDWQMTSAAHLLTF